VADLIRTAGKWGEQVIVHSGVVVIGADGFGFAPDSGPVDQDPQTGQVIIGSDCELECKLRRLIGGAMDGTAYWQQRKIIDNQVQVGHGTIGDHTVISGCVGIAAGSTHIGRHVMVGWLLHPSSDILIFVMTPFISATTFVTKSITEPGTYVRHFT
jgi:UDP-3-O-[3-hydroxymyristoyl] glucosamine N-acyltransferase